MSSVLVASSGVSFGENPSVQNDVTYRLKYVSRVTKRCKPTILLLCLVYDVTSLLSGKQDIESKENQCIRQ